jgi:hypothetical protein
MARPFVVGKVLYLYCMSVVNGATYKKVGGYVDSVYIASTSAALYAFASHLQ